MAASLNQLQQALAYSFSDHSLLLLALSHRSVGASNNERLEFLGDSIVNHVIAEDLFHRFPNAREGELSRLRALLVKGETLAEVALEIGLGDHLLLGPGELKSGGFRRGSILADGVEALVGAILLDSGYSGARDVVLTLFSQRLESLDLDLVSKDPKTRLQELLQSRVKKLPRYELIRVTGSDHEQIFHVECSMGEHEEQFSGQGSSRRRAEQEAARVALAFLAEAKNG